MAIALIGVCGPAALATPTQLVSPLERALAEAPPSSNCTDKPSCWPPGSAMHQLLVQAEQRTKADMELERENKRLMAELRKAKLAPGTEQIVRNMLGRWQAQRSNECHLLGMATGAGDTWRHAHASNCDLSLSKARAAALKKATACVARAAAEPSQPERALNCLEPLMPLTAGVRSKIFD